MLLTEEYYEKYRLHKEQYDRIIVMFQVGKFYEAYSSDSDDEGSGKEMSRILHMALTKKNKSKEIHKFSNPYMCGFPTYMLMKHLTRINDMGYAVALYDQSENPLEKNRVLKGIYTQNIRKEFADQEMGSNCVVYAYGIEKYPIQEGRLRYYEYRQYFCYIQMTSGKIYFYESKDTDMVRMMDKFFIQNSPEEIIVCHEGLTDIEVKTIKEKIENNTKKLLLEEWDFYNENSREKCDILQESIKNYNESNLEMFPQLHNLLSRLVVYINKHDHFLTKQLVIGEDAWTIEGVDSMMQFNRDLFRELFIFGVSEERSENVEERVKTLYGMLGKGMNVMGMRYLAKLLKYPKANQKDIQKVQEKLNTSICSQKLKMFKSLPDLEWYFLRWRRNNLNFRLLSNLLFAYKNLEEFYVDCSFGRELKKFNKHVENMWNLEMMEKYPSLVMIYEDFFEHNDVSVRNEIESLKNEVLSLYLKFEKVETSDLKLVCKDEVMEYYFEIASKKYAKWSSTQKKLFMEVEKTSTVYRIIPHTLIQTRTEMANKFRDLRVRQIRLYQKQCEELFETFGNFLETFNEKIVEDSTFGILQQFFEKNGYTCPVLQDKYGDSYIEATKLRHALIEYVHDDKIYTPCDCSINPKKELGKLIYGMNASGKSTYMKAIGTSLWLAQCGLYVPATTFHFFPYQRIYSKFNHFDNIFKGHSLFVAEMNELQYILQNSAKGTLLLLDELISGTEIHSSASLIVSVIDEFMEKNISFCFTTHIHWIGKFLAEKYTERLKLFHFLFDTKKDIRHEKLITTNIDDFYDRNIQSGSGPSLYGIEVAEQVGITKTITERAKKYRNGISFRFDVHDKPVKRSKYNSKVKMDECISCGSRDRLHTHHIFPQKLFEKGDVIQGFKKNASYNLIPLCEICHMRTHQQENVIATSSE